MTDMAARTARAIGARHVVIQVDEEGLARVFVRATLALGHFHPDVDYLCNTLLAERARQEGVPVLLTGWSKSLKQPCPFQAPEVF